MNKATEIMRKEINDINFEQSKNVLISNVTASEISDKNEIKEIIN